MQEGPLGVREVAAIGLAVLSALEAAHTSGVLHRDVKPSNVLITEAGRVVLTDFGLATLDENEGTVTQTGLILGSPQYVSPERARSGVSSPESDLWSLGATLYAAVEGRSPYARPTALGTLVALATERPDPMRLAGDLKPVLVGLLRRDPKDRLAVPEAKRMLRQVAAGESIRRFPWAGRRPADESDTSGVVAPLIDREGITPALAALGRSTVPAQRRPVDGMLNLGGSATTGSVGYWNDLTGPAAWTRGGARTRKWALVAVAVIALVGVGIVVARSDLFDRSNTDRRGAGGSTAQVAGPRLAVTAPPETLPPGWTLYRHKSGFVVPVPADWTAQQVTDTGILTAAPKNTPTLQVGQWNPADPAPVVAFQRAEDATTLPSYRRIRIDPLPGGGADWEYTYVDPKLGPMHGLDRGLVIRGESYLIQWRTTVADWPAQQAGFDLVTGGFRATPRVTTAAT
jgi:hypothetical protein